MKVRRTHKTEWHGHPLKHAGEVDIWEGRERIERLFRSTVLGRLVNGEKISHEEKARLETDRWLAEGVGAIRETESGYFELIEL